jgi:hypothetical protein
MTQRDQEKENGAGHKGSERKKASGKGRIVYLWPLLKLLYAVLIFF